MITFIIALVIGIVIGMVIGANNTNKVKKAAAYAQIEILKEKLKPGKN